MEDGEHFMALQDLTNEALLALAEPLMDNCLEGSNALNHEQHVRDFTNRMKAIVTPR
jgi:hypothetical protein